MTLTIFDLHADIFKVLANPKRLEIIHLIRDRELTVSDLEEMLDMRQANLSQHLMVLRENGLVKTRRDGTYIFYSLTDDRILKASDLVRDVLQGKLKDSPNIAGVFSEDMNIENHLKEHVDPVCDMHVSVKDAADKYSYQGHDFYFCAMGCKEKFIKDPRKYLKESHVG